MYLCNFVKWSTQKRIIRIKNEKLDFNKIKNGCSSKITIKERKMQGKDLEKIFAIYKCTKNGIQNIYFYKAIIKRKYLNTKNEGGVGKDLDRYFIG